jgi:hypothetical protein
MPNSAVVAPKSTDAVQGWRLECLIAAGYSRPAALELSERCDVDLHLAARLLEGGCSVDTALRILR